MVGEHRHLQLDPCPRNPPHDTPAPLRLRYVFTTLAPSLSLLCPKSLIPLYSVLPTLQCTLSELFRHLIERAHTISLSALSAIIHSLNLLGIAAF